MGQMNQHKVFNNPARVVEGWYWALRSDELRKKQVKPLQFLGRDLAIYRGENGKVVAMDAYCPHMGAHLAEGRVEKNELRCFFHFWKFNDAGDCTEIPCQKNATNISKQRTWPVEERYGLIWIWTGRSPTAPIPFVPELKGADTVSKLGSTFLKMCHPSVMMINAIDAQHFNSVHRLPVALNLEPHVVDEKNIEFRNTTRMPQSNAFTRFAGKFYEGALTYAMSYWFGSTGSVTVGPDFLHFYIIFALRPTADGKSEGQTILITKRRKGMLGHFINPLLLFLTGVVGNYFAKGDTKIFKSIRFDFKNPIKADFSIIAFIQHVEKQKFSQWGLGQDVALTREQAYQRNGEFAEWSQTKTFEN